MIRATFVIFACLCLTTGASLAEDHGWTELHPAAPTPVEAGSYDELFDAAGAVSNAFLLAKPGSYQKGCHLFDFWLVRRAAFVKLRKLSFFEGRNLAAAGKYEEILKNFCSGRDKTVDPVPVAESWVGVLGWE